jgi:RNA polymerase sigma-70 factor (ECF subfamily)
MHQEDAVREGKDEESDFAEFIRRIREGDERAATELVRLYEPLIRREVRLHIRDRRLRRLFESQDVCQSVLGSFFAGTALGRYDFETPGQLVKLLAAMTRNKVAAAARGQHRQRRDNRRTTDLADGGEQIADQGPSPSETVGGEELIRQLRAELTDDERVVAELRRQGLAWDDIAARLGGTAGARRVQLARAIKRISRMFGLA